MELPKAISYLVTAGSGLLVVLTLWGFFKKFFPPEEQGPPAEFVPPKPPPEPRDFTLRELYEFNGTNDKPIYIGCKGKVYDVSSKANFYGPGGAYSAFAGRDASRALAIHSTSESDAANPSLEGLGSSELSALDEWERMFETRYNIVGRIVEKGG